MEMDRVPLWRANADHVPVRQLVEDFASYLYLPRLQEPLVLGRAVEQGARLLTWEQDSFAFADGYDEAAGRYQGHSPSPQPGDGRETKRRRKTTSWKWIDGLLVSFSPTASLPQRSLR